jgi:hypothetical protein
MTHNNVSVERIENIVEINSVGLQGARGNGVLNGTGAPSSSLGENGDFYIDTSTNKMYGPKTSGVWGEPVNLGGTYVHTQGVASTTWTINHNLEYYPSIEVVDSAGTVVIGNYTYVNVNTIIATFTSPFAGKAYLS